MISKRDIYLAIVGIVLVLNVIIGVHFYAQGKRIGQMGEALKQLNIKLDSTDIILANDSIMLSTAKHQSDSIGNRRDKLRSNIKVVHDTTYAEPDSGSDDIEQVISDNPQIAHLLIVDDSTITYLRRVNKDQDKIINDLYIKGSLQLSKIAILESNQHPPRITRGLQGGVGYCRNAAGGTPCLYAGYGYSVRF